MRTRRWLMLATLAPLPMVAGAQSAPTPPAPEAPSPTTIGGTPAIDLITLGASDPSAPLRFGNVVPGSERIQMDGRMLSVGTDYAVDYESGVVYLKVPARAGSSLTISYRYGGPMDPKVAAATRMQTGMKFDIVPGGLSQTIRLGYAERTADGRVLTGNAFGLNNSFNFGTGNSLSGVYVIGQRSQSRNAMGLRMDANAKPGEASEDTGASSLIVQSLRSSALGGKIEVDYQDVSKNFSAFSTLGDGGMAADRIAQLRAERGLTRFGYRASDLGVGGAKVGVGFRQIGEEGNALQWRDYSFASGGLTVGFRSQSVDAGFTRFRDLAEADRAQLEKEKGLRREDWSGAFASKVGKLSYSAQTISDVATSGEIERREWGFDSSRFKFSYGTQETSAGFGRLDSLLDSEKGRYGREVGLRRQWASLDAALGATPLSFSQTRLDGPAGSFVGTDVALKGKTWVLTRADRKTDDGFAGFGGMNEGEQDGHVRAIAAMYGPNVATRPEDRGGFALGIGLGRTATSLVAEPFRGWKLDLARMELKGRADAGGLDRASIGNGKVQVTYRKQYLGDKFDQQSSLLEFERQQLGTIAGLERSDFGLKMALGGAKTFSFDRMQADAPDGRAHRTTVAYKDKRIEVTVNAREVESGMASVASLVDPERDLLNGMQGTRQRDARIKWEIASNLRLDAFGQDAITAAGAATSVRNILVDWNPDRRTSFNYTRLEQKMGDPVASIFDSLTERMSLTRDLGRVGRLEWTDERIENAGTGNPGLDSRRQYFAFQTKINDVTQARTEQTRTEFGDGSQEKVSTNTVSTALSKRAGVSVSDVNVDRADDARDEKRRDYGFWLDLGRGIRFSYGYARQLTGPNAGQTVATATLGQNAGRTDADKVNTVQQGTVGGVAFGGGYGANRWDQDGRTQGFSNLSISNVAPQRWGFLTDVKYQFAMDAASDYAAWQRESRLARFAAAVGKNAFSYEFNSQLDPASGIRGIDRAFRFSTDAAQTAPFAASVYYKVRTLPNDDQIMIRDFSFTARPAKALTITNTMQTNPELPRGDVLLGSLPQAARSNKWALDWSRGAGTVIGLSWQELINEQANALSRTGGVTMTLFGNSGSPLKLFYGLEQTDGNVPRRTLHRYSLQFDQRPGPNQTLSLFLGNLNFQNSIADGADRNNWTMRLNYQLRF